MSGTVCAKSPHHFEIIIYFNIFSLGLKGVNCQIKLFFAIEFIAICQNFHKECSISLIFIYSDWSNPKMSHQIFSSTPKLSYIIHRYHHNTTSKNCVLNCEEKFDLKTLTTHQIFLDDILVLKLKCQNSASVH